MFITMWADLATLEERRSGGLRTNFDDLVYLNVHGHHTIPRFFFFCTSLATDMRPSQPVSGPAALISRRTPKQLSHHGAYYSGYERKESTQGVNEILKSGGVGNVRKGRRNNCTSMECPLANDCERI